MNVILTKDSLYRSAPYAKEAELEEAILKIQNDLFGKNRIYLDVKKKIGKKGIQQNIPDGYLLDLSSKKPKLYFVENELASHDVLRHIALQILEFSLAFQAEPRLVRNIVFRAIEKDPNIQLHCEKYAANNGYRNLDHLLDHLIFENHFSALIIIDEIPDRLQNVLAEKFAFSVDVIQIGQYKNSDNECFYLFEPFLQDVVADISVNPLTSDKAINCLDISSIDTIVVPAREDGFNEVFINEDCWYAIRMKNLMREQIKYIAAYQVAPISAITHIATVKSIEPYGENGKWKIIFSDSAKAITPVMLNKEGQVRALQSPRYTVSTKIFNAKTLDDIWQTNQEGAQ
ncbi:MAG: hypothetical protein P4M14_06425 [Gammaproteobacteria bacterium]|nr:hypothetical protein [Gammaproteobacteria bacterium]